MRKKKSEHIAYDVQKQQLCTINRDELEFKHSILVDLTIGVSKDGEVYLWGKKPETLNGE